MFIVAALHIHIIDQTDGQKTKLTDRQPRLRTTQKEQGSRHFPVSCAKFFSLYLRLGVQSSLHNDLGQHLIDRRGVEAIQPFLRRIRDGRVCVLCHHIGDVLKHLQRERIQNGILLIVLINYIFQILPVFKSIPVKPHPVNARNGGFFVTQHQIYLLKNPLLRKIAAKPDIAKSPQSSPSPFPILRMIFLSILR